MHEQSQIRLRPLATKATGELNIFGFYEKSEIRQEPPVHTLLRTDSNTLGVDGAKIGVFKERDKISLNGFLESSDGGRLEAKIRLKVLGDFTDEALKREFPNQKFGRFLVATNFTKSHSSYNILQIGLNKEFMRQTWLIPVRLLDATS